MAAPTTIEAASLSDAERRSLERFAAAIGEQLGEELVGVWLYGSRARGERLGPDSDVDVIVVVDGEASSHEEAARRLASDAAEAEGGGVTLSIQVVGVGEVQRQRRIGSFFYAEVDRDKIVVGGESFDAARAHLDGEPTLEGDRAARMSPRSEQFMEIARDALLGARASLDAGACGRAASDSYFAMVNAARAALSEMDEHSRTHSGLWNLFRVRLVEAGRLPGQLDEAAKRARQAREAGDYRAVRPSRGEAETIVADAERFLAAIEREFGAG